jgi:hypothetical protein
MATDTLGAESFWDMYTRLVVLTVARSVTKYERGVLISRMC